MITLITYDKIRKIAIGQGDNYTTGCLLNYNYFNNYYKVIAVDLSKQQALDADPKAIQKINFTGYLNRVEDENDNTIMFFIIEEVKETILDFSQGNFKVVQFCFCVNIKMTHYNTLNVKFSITQK